MCYGIQCKEFGRPGFSERRLIHEQEEDLLVLVGQSLLAG